MLRSTGRSSFGSIVGLWLVGLSLVYATARAQAPPQPPQPDQEGVEVLTRGLVAGFTLTSQAYGATIYLSDTATGILGDAAGTVSTKIGRVWPSSDGSLTKVLFVCPALV